MTSNKELLAVKSVAGNRGLNSIKVGYDRPSRLIDWCRSDSVGEVRVLPLPSTGPPDSNLALNLPPAATQSLPSPAAQ